MNNVIYNSDEIRKVFEQDDEIPEPHHNGQRKQHDAVNSPAHYMICGKTFDNQLCEMREVQRHLARFLEGMMAADHVNSQKYLGRAPYKGKYYEDICKSAFFIESLKKACEEMIAAGEYDDFQAVLDWRVSVFQDGEIDV